MLSLRGPVQVQRGPRWVCHGPDGPEEVEGEAEKGGSIMICLCLCWLTRSSQRHLEVFPSIMLRVECDHELTITRIPTAPINGKCVERKTDLNNPVQSLTLEAL